MGWCGVKDEELLHKKYRLDCVGQQKERME